jgi:hypothetical protein
MAAAEFPKHKSDYAEATTVVWARAWTSGDWQRKVGLSADEIASIGAKLQSFGLTSRIEGQTGGVDSFRVTPRGEQFIEYVRAAAEPGAS